MYCQKCGAEIPQGHKFCGACGQPVGAVEYVNVPSEPIIQYQYVLPEENRPISSWGYVGFDVLFAIPFAPALLFLILYLSFLLNDLLNCKNIIA